MIMKLQLLLRRVRIHTLTRMTATNIKFTLILLDYLQTIDPTHSSKETNSSKDMMKRSSTSKPKRLNSKNETTGSAMSKITNGFNFLKERSNHLADELQSMNKDRIKSQSQKHARKGSQDEFDVQSSVRPTESQLQHLDSHVDRGRRSDEQSTNAQEREI